MVYKSACLFFQVTSSSDELEKDLQGKHPSITPTQPKAATESKEQLKTNIEAQPEEYKQTEKKPSEEVRLTTKDASLMTVILALKRPFDGLLEKKKVRIFLFNMKYSTFSRLTVKAIQDSGRIGTLSL